MTGRPSGALKGSWEDPDTGSVDTTALGAQIKQGGYVVDCAAVARALLRRTDPRCAIFPALSRSGARGPAGPADRPDR